MALQKKNFSDIITFARSTNATRVNPSGNTELVPAGQPRFDYDPITKMPRGILVEEARTRLNLVASDFSGQSRPAIAFNSTGQSRKGFPETKLVPDTSAGPHISTIYSHGLDSVISSNTVIARAGEYRYLILARKDSYTNINDSFARFDLQTGTIQADYTGTAKIINLGDGMYRCYLRGANSNGVNNRLTVGVESVPSPVGFADSSGDGVSGLFLYHAQCEDGLFETSPILGEGAQVTRTADSVRVNTISPWYNPNEGTLFVEASVSSPIAGVFNSMVGMREASSSDTAQISITRNGVSNRVTGFVRSAAGATQVDINALTDLIAQVSSKVALAYKQDSFSLSKDGAAAITDDMGLVPNSMARLVIGATNVMTSILNGHVRAIRYYPRRLTNAELQALTS